MLRAKIKDGDRSAFEEVYRNFSSKVYALAFKYSQNRSLAEDIVQEVFIKLWRNRENISEELSMEHQLFTLTKNIFIDNTRTKIREEKLKKTYQISSQLEVTDNSMHSDSESFTKLRRALNDLPERQKEILELAKFQGLTYAEIGQKLGISKHTVSSHISDSLKKLKHKLSG